MRVSGNKLNTFTFLLTGFTGVLENLRPICGALSRKLNPEWRPIYLFLYCNDLAYKQLPPAFIICISPPPPRFPQDKISIQICNHVPFKVNLSERFQRNTIILQSREDLSQIAAECGPDPARRLTAVNGYLGYLGVKLHCGMNTAFTCIFYAPSYTDQILFEEPYKPCSVK